MPNSDEVSERGSAEARKWAGELSGRIGKAVKRRRDELGLSASELSRRTSELGYPITRGTIAKIEGNHRGGKFDVAELMTLAAALAITPIELLYPGLPDGRVVPFPGHPDRPSWHQAEWFSGESLADLLSLVGLSRERAAKIRQREGLAQLLTQDERTKTEGESRAIELLDELQRDIHVLEASIRQAGGVVADDG